MHAHDRFLPEWFERIRGRQITLPRFQRMVAWGHGEVSGLLTTVLRGLPSGATLILQVGDEEKFISRTMVDAPEAGGVVTEQLLDGQQRLTALWRSLNDTYPDRIYLIGFEEDPGNGDRQLPYVYGQARWERNGTRYPLWVDDPKECWRRGFLPIRLLRPEDIMAEIRQWIRRALPEDPDERDLLFDRVIELRDRIKAFNLPYLALPASTPKEVALDVFIKMNTSSVRLSTYDIVVALVEEETGKSLHDKVEELAAAVPRARDYADLPGLVLDVAALRQDRVPSQAGIKGLDFGRMIAEWDVLVRGVEGMVHFLEEETVFDELRVPSYTALPIIAALWDELPVQSDRLGNARHVLRKFLWRAFLTNRYERSSTTAALQDFRVLRRVLREEAAEAGVPIFDEETYPVPTAVMLMQAGWPKNKTILGRGILALQLRCGAEDLADGRRATVASITAREHPREYHHLFPESLLEDAGVPRWEIYRALNCALITWRTNRTISNKDPLQYLKERADKAALGAADLERRLKTHLIPYAPLAVGYEGLSKGERQQRVPEDYRTFLEARAAIVARAARLACSGQPFDLHKAFGETE